jgi:hypothetical protein
MIKLGQNDYKLLFMDTNVLREVVTNTNYKGKSFFEKFYASHKPQYIICFSILNIIELKPYADIYKKFMEFFTDIPCLLLYPQKIIIQEEYDAYKHKRSFDIKKIICYAFSPLKNDKDENFESFLNKLDSDENILSVFKSEIYDLSAIVESWNNQRRRKVDLLHRLGYPADLIQDGYLKKFEKETIVKDLNNRNIKLDYDSDYTKFPSLRIMEYSQFARVYQTKKKITKNDVMDVMLSSVIPYVDSVITENFQANVYKKAKSIIPEISSLEIYTLKELV